MVIEQVKLADLTPYEGNAKQHPPEQVRQIVASIRDFGFNDPLAIDENNVIIEGHGRYMALIEMGADTAPCIRLTGMTAQQKQAYILVHNKLTMNTGFDLQQLDLELRKITDYDMAGFDFELPGEKKLTTREKVAANPIDTDLFTDFVVPPFSVLDSRQGYWQDRKNWWIEDIGLKSVEGRRNNLVYAPSMDSGNLRGTSIFDPVLCEIMYKWFCPDGGMVFDPFAGGSVRGIVAACCGHHYLGIDLSDEQIAADDEAVAQSGFTASEIEYYCDDSQNMDAYIEDGTADMIMTCPPYADLEVYSDDPRDISNMPYEDFARIYRTILTGAARKLKKGRFAIVTISDVRDKKGYYRDLPALTKQIMLDAGLNIYNEMILLNVIGSSGLRARKAMANKKVVRTHQNVLAFYKAREEVLCFINGSPKDLWTKEGD